MKQLLIILLLVGLQAKALDIVKSTWGKDWQTGIALVKCESTYRETVVNRSGATGYFQIMARLHGFTVKQMQDGVTNSKVAYKMFKTQGLTPWNPSRSCWKGLI